MPMRFLLCATLAMAAAPAVAGPVLAVLKFQDETGALPLQGGAGRVLTNMLTTELAARPVFTVVERQKLRAVLEEQDLAESGRMSAGEGAQIGKLLGADYLVSGTVTAFEEEIETRVKGGFFGGGRVEQVSKGGYLAVDLRVIDTTTAQIAYARTVEGFTDGGRKLEVYAVGLNDGPDARAVRAAVLEIIDYLECALVRRDACLAEFEAREQRRLDAVRKAAQTN
jgi:curli biogenesis system outer membrane secretion channel CsgG